MARAGTCASGDATLRFLPLFAAENALPAPEPQPDGGFRQWLLPPGNGHYLGDGTAKAFRVQLFGDGVRAEQERKGSQAFRP